MTPRFLARAISFLIAVPLRSMSGASRSALPSIESAATASVFAMPVVCPARSALPPAFILQPAPGISAWHRDYPFDGGAAAARHELPETMSIDNDASPHSVL